MAFVTPNRPQAKSTQKMLLDNHPDRIHVAFDDHRLVANLRAGGTAGAIGCVVQGAIHPGDVPCILEEPGRGRPYLPEA